MDICKGKRVQSEEVLIYQNSNEYPQGIFSSYLEEGLGEIILVCHNWQHWQQQQQQKPDYSHVKYF